MNVKHLFLSLLCISVFSCGGNESNDTPNDPPQSEPPATPPEVTLTADVISVDESSTVIITHSAKDYQDTIITSELSCDMGTLDGNSFTAPSVAIETTATCTVTATDSGNRSTTETLTFTINALTPVLALANGETSATNAKLTTIDVSFAEVSEGLINATLNGETIQLAITPDKQLVYFPPMGATGIQTLTLTVEGEEITYEYQAQDSNANFTDATTYINDFFSITKAQIDTIIADKLARNAPAEEIESLNSFKNSLSLSNELFASLTTSELEYFAQIIFENINVLESVSKPQLLYKSSRPVIAISNRSSLTQCESEAFKTTIYVTSTVALIGATAALTSSGAGTPWGLISGVAVIASGAVWADHVSDTVEICFDAFTTKISQSFSSKVAKMALPTISSRADGDDTLTFFSDVDKRFIAQTKNQQISGSDEFVTTIINGYNRLSNQFNWLFDLIGRSHVPNYAEDAFAESLSVDDFLYTKIDPSNLSLSAITDTGVTGHITGINEDNSFTMNFSIYDLEVAEVEFQFTITDNGHDTPLSTVIDAEVTLNPPIAYSETFSAVIGEDMVARLQADFETGFRILASPQHGTLDLSPAFSFPGGGLFTYMPNETLTENTTDTFTFLATNGSTENNGESNVATITIDITTDPIYASLIGTWHIFEDGYFLQEYWGSACHNKTGQHTEDGYTYNVFTAYQPKVEMTLYADGTMKWGYLAHTIEPSGDWYICPLTGEFQSPGEETDTWNYYRANGVSRVSIPFPYAGGGYIQEVQTGAYQWLNISAGNNENYRYRWERQ